MKTFLSPVTRVCAEVVEMTSNVAQGAWPRRRASPVAPIVAKGQEKTGDGRTQGAARPPSIVRRARLSEICERSPRYGTEDRHRLSFDVASFCLELDTWRASLTLQQAAAAAPEHQSSAGQSLPAAGSRAPVPPSDVIESLASLESIVTNAIRSIEGAPHSHPVPRLTRGA